MSYKRIIRKFTNDEYAYLRELLAGSLGMDADCRTTKYWQLSLRNVQYQKAKL